MSGTLFQISVGKKVVQDGLIATYLLVGFGKPAENRDIVVEVTKRVETLALKGGQLVLIDGPMSAHVAMVVAHGLADKFESVACFDKRTSEYVVCISRNHWFVGHSIPRAAVSDWIPAKTV